MKKILTRLMPLVVTVLAASLPMQAQGFYDDDIYYDASKAKKEKQEKAIEAAKKAARRNYIPSQPVADYPGSDTYVVNSGSTRDVDEYNRRSAFSGSREETDSVSLDRLMQGDFANTRRIERFSNPDVVSGSGDGELMDYYYAEQSRPQTTIIVNTVDPWYYGGIYSPWYNGYYSYNPWRWGWNSWYDPWYSPSWSWGWGPSWSWSWGWGGGWHHPGWGHPGWHYPGWGHPGHGPIWGGGSWRPSSSGASRPHSPGGVKPSTSGRRPGNSYYGGGSRPAYTLPSGTNQSVPGSRVNQSGRRPSTVNGGSPASGSGYRNNGTIPGSRVNQGRQSTGNSYTPPSNNSNPSWNSGSRNNGSSWGSGSRGGGGGGGRSSGGGRSGRH